MRKTRKGHTARLRAMLVNDTELFESVTAAALHVLARRAGMTITTQKLGPGVVLVERLT